MTTLLQNNNIQHGIEKLTQIVIQNKNSKFSDGKWELYELCKYPSKGKGKCRNFHWLSCLLRGLATLLINLIFHIWVHTSQAVMVGSAAAEVLPPVGQMQYLFLLKQTNTRTKENDDNCCFLYFPIYLLCGAMQTYCMMMVCERETLLKEWHLAWGFCTLHTRVEWFCKEEKIRPLGKLCHIVLGPQFQN